MYNFSFICRASRADKQGLSAIEMVMIINGNRTYLALPKKVDAEQFKKIMTSNRSNEIKDYCALMRIKINKAINELMLNDVAITPQNLKEILLSSGVKVYSINDLFNDYKQIVNAKIKAGEVASNLIDRYNTSMNHFINYIGKDRQATAIHNEDIVKYMLDLKTSFSESTVTKYLQHIKSAFTFAFENGKINRTPFAGIKLSRKLKDVPYLTSDELERIEKKQMIGRLASVRDCFIFAAHTGLAFVDMGNICKEDILESDGLHYVKKERTKTDITFTTILDETCMKILKKYNYRLPIISNQKYNAYLKEIGDICGIKKSLHSHIARHTFATSMLNKGMPIEIVAKMLGHSTTRITQHYAKLMDKTVLNEYKKLG